MKVRIRSMVRMGRRRTPRCEKRKGMKEDVLSRLREFIENEVRSGSMDLGCITPTYVYRMWEVLSRWKILRTG